MSHLKVELTTKMIRIFITFSAIYATYASPCVPSRGHSALIIGQDFESINNYTAAVGVHDVSDGFMSYTALKSNNGDLSGLENAANYGSGIEWSLGLLQKYPGKALQLGLWLVDSLDAINKGALDKKIDYLIEFLHVSTNSTAYNPQVLSTPESMNRRSILLDSLHLPSSSSSPAGTLDDTPLESTHKISSTTSSNSTNTTDTQRKKDKKRLKSHSLISPVYLRIGYEFDNPNNNYEPEAYKEAFRHIVERFRMSGKAENIAFVWHSYQSADFRLWYPGREYVDWCGVSIFEQPYKCQNALECKMPYAEEMSSFCQQEGKPMMIAESTPMGGIIKKVESNNDASNDERKITSPILSDDEEDEKAWNSWFVPVLSFIERNDVRVWSYINSDWDAQPMWASAGFGDTRVQIHHGIFKRWKNQVLKSPRFSWRAEVACVTKDEGFEDFVSTKSWKAIFVATLSLSACCCVLVIVYWKRRIRRKDYKEIAYSHAPSIELYTSHERGQDIIIVE